MKLILKFGVFGSAVLGGMLALSACGDDVTKVYRTTEENSGMEIAGSADDFDDCDSASIGKMMFASDENAAYICADSGWTPLSEKASAGKDGASCTAEKLSDGSGYRIVCGEDSAGVVLNGENGTAGTSCTAEKLSDGSGYRIICGEDSVGVILNGEKGADGADGSGCSIADNGDGTLSQVCGTDTVTLYKALCDGKAYDPNTAYCIENTLHPYSCGDRGYDVSEEFCDVRDSTLYGYVKIGSQTWMAENLNYDTTASYCYDNNIENCEKYGRLYTWDAATQACPSGWHLPDSTEWNALQAHVAQNITGGADSIGYALKAKEGWGEDKDGSNAFGFNALPAGYLIGGGFYAAEQMAAFWGATDSEDKGYARGLVMDNPGMLVGFSDKGNASSVRCVKDATDSEALENVVKYD